MNVFANIDLEKSVLGCLISYEQTKDKIPGLSENDFSNGDNRTIFRALANLYLNNNPIDIITVTDELIDRMHESERFTEIVTSLNHYEPSAAHLEYNIKLLKEYTLRRNLYKIGNELVKKSGEVQESPIDLHSEITRNLLDMEINTSSTDESMHNTLQLTYNAILDAFSGKNIGTKINLTDFDTLTGGIFKGELTIIGARPGVGKSALGMHIAQAFASQNKTVEFISREMSREQYGMRLIAYEGGISTEKIRRGKLDKEEIGKLINAIKALSKNKIFINTTSKTPAQILSVCRQRKQQDGLDLLVVDYLQLLKSDRKCDNRVQEVSEISRALKEITLELNIPVIAMSQLNRNAVNIPSMADLRESGAIEQDADNIILMHEINEPDQNGNKNMRLIVAKQRQGNTGYIDVMFNPAIVRFYSIFKG